MASEQEDRELLQMAVLAGEIMIRSGAETYRVEDTVDRILRVATHAKAESIVLTTGLMVTLSFEGREPLSVIKRIHVGSQNLGRVCKVNKVSRDFCDGKLTLSEAHERLREIETEHTYRTPLVMLGQLLGTAGFCVLFGGSLLDAAASVLCALTLSLTILVLGPKIGKPFFTTLLSAAAITVCSTGEAFFSERWLGVAIQSQYPIVGGMMLIVPGLALTSATRDTLQGDYISAGSRAIEAMMIAVSVALGVSAGMAVSDVLHISYTLDFRFALSAPDALSFLKAILASFVAIVGFSVVFEIPKRHILETSLVALISWAVFLSCDGAGLSTPWASFFAALVSDFCAYFCARLFKAPVTVFLIGGILPLVPGFGIYRTAYNIMYGGEVSSVMTETLLITGAIALAIFVMDTLFDMERRIRKRYRGKAHRQ